jgi:hypothetical protein
MICYVEVPFKAGLTVYRNLFLDHIQTLFYTHGKRARVAQCVFFPFIFLIKPQFSKNYSVVIS